MNINLTNQRLTAVFNALDNVSVKGYQNVLNMAAAMQLLSDERQELSVAIEEQMNTKAEVAAEAAESAARAK